MVKALPLYGVTRKRFYVEGESVCLCSFTLQRRLCLLHNKILHSVRAIQRDRAESCA